MSKLSSCIFRWDEGDIAALRRAKSLELQSCDLEGDNPQLSPAELATHCRCETRGVAETEALIDKLLTSLMGATGLETLGVPLFDNDRIATTWDQQRGHLACIQDPPGVSLYRQVGTKLKGGLALPVYRCARGSTSLESFHLHINRFIPGESASCANFQAYMLEGIVRWNEDRHSAALSEKTSLRCYSYELQNSVSRAAAPLQLDPGVNLKQPARYTGELIGVEYLLAQTGQPMGPLRLVESVVILLMEMYPQSYQRKGSHRRTSRWALLLRDYTRIRRLLLHNPDVRAKTSIQLFEINQYTLTQWHNATKKTEEVQTLLQGTDPPQATFTGRNLPEARTDPPFEARADSGRIQYSPPQEPDRSGQARKMQPSKQAPDVEQSGQSIPTVHSGALLRLEDVVRNLVRDVVQIYGIPPAAPLGLPPAAQPGPSVLSSVLSVPSVPPTLAAVRERTKKRCRVKDEDRKYKREKLFNTCKRCGQPKLKETGHKGYKGYSHCPSDSESYNQFLKRVKRLLHEKKNV
ncbi:hypothetical protein PoB_003857400 [Plakobranchus ocellatus]|uniref:Uncharacterized protein n=1 Tax=Plakobranchus ocellatus TaxID=259542 RepID=A0AAV4B080_9GAST|nr:hypothetical protein PoB_003857400 [Plakobranchus ocellatus]